MASVLSAYVDDLSTLGIFNEKSWKISRLVASCLQFLGIQDAPGKIKLDNDHWAGGMYSSENGERTKTVTREKWQKGKI